jgi:hypothetical protein
MLMKMNNQDIKFTDMKLRENLGGKLGKQIVWQVSTQT